MNKGKTEIPIADSESGVRRFRAPQPETPDIGESNPGGVWAIGRRTTTYREEPLAMDKSVKKKDDSTRFPTLAPETMAVGSEHPRESLEEEGGNMKSRIVVMSVRERSGQEPSEPISENSAFGPVRPRETEEMEDGREESLHDANEEGCDMACETVDEGTRE